MTVLVLSLSIPTIVNASNSEIATYILSLGPTILSYVMSFLILSVFWVRHHNIFHFIVRVDGTLIWLNIFFLLTVGFVPFSTELIGRFWTAEISTIIYGANLIASGLFMQGIWMHTVSAKLLVDNKIDEKIMARVNRRLLGGPILYLLAIVISLVVPGGTRIAVAVYVVTLVYYVIGGSLGRGPSWRVQPRAPARQ